MTRIRFHQGLDDLRQKLLAMGGLAEHQLQLAIRAYRERSPELCRQVMEGEPRINHAEREIDQLALDLLAMQQPMAVDLRFIMAVIKCNADLERVGDQAVNIAERAREMGSLPAVELPVDLPLMASLAATMIRRALDAFVNGDPEAAQAVLTLDDEVDRMNDEAFVALNRMIEKAPFLAHQCLDALIIARNLERIADHATNMAEDVIFWISGADVRHHAGKGSF